jgi:mRNA-degrading endonuclease RelE of RelBE toxin-antitoxin system
MAFKVFWTETFKKEYLGLPVDEQKRIQKFIRKQLAVNPNVGKPVSITNIREKKLNGRRVYFIVYETKVIVLMVAISGKKDQQATIDLLKSNLDNFLRLAEELEKE